MKVYTARHWTLTLRFIDAFVLLLLLSLAWVTYAMNRGATEFRWPLSWSGVFSLALIPVIRGIAVKQRKKSEEAERTTHAR